MEAASAHLGEEFQLRRSPKLESSGFGEGAAEVHGGPRGPRKPQVPRESGCAPRGPLAPAETPWSGSWSAGRPREVGAGLRNLGNSCYANAALQCLTYTPPLARYLLSGRHSGACARRGASCTLCALQAHVTRALLRPGHAIVPEGALLAGFHAYRQEDAHEFLLFTLDALQRACEPAPQRPPSPPPPPLGGGPSQEDATLIRGIFGGHWRSRVQCLRCQGVSDTLDPYLDIGLDIRAAQSVTQALDLLVRPERLDGYRCGKCLLEVQATKTLRLHAASRVLTLVLKRFSALGEGKVERDVRYPEQLDVRPYLWRGRRALPPLYRLSAVLVHAGRTCQGGHYFCYVRTAGGGWFKMDDARVSACDASVALSQRAYVLFYVQTSELEGDGGNPRCPRTELKLAPSSTQRGPDSAPGFTGPGYDEPAKHTSSEQRPRLPEPSRPKPRFSLSELRCALPAGALVIHQSRGGGGGTERLLNRPAGDDLPGEAKGTDQGSGPSGGVKKNRKKKKKGRRSVPACL